MRDDLTVTKWPVTAAPGARASGAYEGPPENDDNGVGEQPPNERSETIATSQGEGSADPRLLQYQATAIEPKTR